MIHRILKTDYKIVIVNEKKVTKNKNNLIGMIKFVHRILNFVPVMAVFFNITNKIV